MEDDSKGVSFDPRELEGMINKDFFVIYLGEEAVESTRNIMKKSKKYSEEKIKEELERLSANRGTLSKIVKTKSFGNYITDFLGLLGNATDEDGSELSYNNYIFRLEKVDFREGGLPVLYGTAGIISSHSIEDQKSVTLYPSRFLAKKRRLQVELL